MKTNNEIQPGIVKKMRDIRDELGEKLLNMTQEEQKAYYREKTLKLMPDFYERLEQHKY